MEDFLGCLDLLFFPSDKNKEEEKFLSKCKSEERKNLFLPFPEPNSVVEYFLNLFKW